MEKTELLRTSASGCSQAFLLADHASATIARVLCFFFSVLLLWMSVTVVALFAVGQRDIRVSQKLKLGTEPCRVTTALKEGAFSEPSPLNHQVLHLGL